MSGSSLAALTGDATRDSDGGARKRPRHLYPECTKKDGGKCRLLHHRRDINEVLLHAGLELREDDRSRCSGDVRLALARTVECRCLYCNRDLPEDPRQSEALNFAERLLCEHHCITSVELRRVVIQRRSLRAALESNCGVKALTVWAHQGKAVDDDVAELTDTFSRLDELIFMYCDSCGRCGITIPVASTLLDEHVVHLTTVDVADVAMTRQMAARFTLSLERSRTVTDLTVGTYVTAHDDGSDFRRYLTSKDNGLKKLTYRGLSGGDMVLQSQIDALCTMTTLEELTFDYSKGIAQSARRSAVFAKLVSLSPSLRYLRLPKTICHLGTLSEPPENAAQCMEPWVAALGKNSKLNVLHIDLLHFGEPEFRAFMEAVTDSDSLRSVVVRHLPATVKLDVLCRTIRELGLRDRVVVEDQYYYCQDMSTLRQCPEIANVTIAEPCDLRLERHTYLESVRAALEALSSIPHRMSLSVNCRGFDSATFAALASFIRSRSTHTGVELQMQSWWHSVGVRQHQRVARALVSAVASNPDITSVSISGLPPPSYNCLNILADGARRNRNLVQFRLVPLCSGSIGGLLTTCNTLWFERRQGAPEYANTVLAAIQETTRNNASRVSAAAGFVLRRQDSERGARYLESMHDHPHLLELVLQGAPVSNGQAKAMIREALMHVRYCSVGEFMRLAGVVKSKVECINPRRTGVQLADIGEHCWLQIRRYIKLDDIVGV